MPSKEAIGFIGAGRVATVLASALAAQGYCVQAVYSRTRASAERLARAVGTAQRPAPAGTNGAHRPSSAIAAMPVVAASAQDVADGCELVFITTPDDAIAGVAASIRWCPGMGAIHCSGALTVEALAPAVQAGGEAAGFHPLQTFARPGTSLEGVTFALEGHGHLVQRLQTMATELGARWVLVPSERKALYHVAGVLASNYVVTLVNAATGVLEDLGIPRDRGLEALLPLLEATVANMRALGIQGSLTGPIARGDAGTVRRHLESLEAAAPRLMEVYRSLGRETIPIALAKGPMAETKAESLRTLFKHGRRDPDPSRDGSRPGYPRR